MSFDAVLKYTRDISSTFFMFQIEGYPSKTKRQRQYGFSLIEVSIVTTIMMLLAIVGIPAIQGYVVESKVPRVAEELQRFVARLKVTTNGFGASPYAGLDTRVLANSLRGSSVVAVSGEGAGANVAHGLGGQGVSGRGVIRVAPYALSGARHHIR
jgi:Tfp pilus assembly major pilin PilA